MGRRARQRDGARQRPAERPPEAEGARGRAQARKQALRRSASAAGSAAEQRIRQRPAAPWDPFPLTELAIFVGIVLMVIGVLLASTTGRALAGSGAALACLGGLETALREHRAGYRAHSGILAGAATLATLILTGGLFSLPPVVSAAAAIGVFAVLFPVLRRGFIRKSGGSGVL